jgi:AraC-like DNA-binding protein/mannose-6-phosphate isomerase-like protein (cupin superfamily)
VRLVVHYYKLKVIHNLRCLAPPKGVILLIRPGKVAKQLNQFTFSLLLAGYKKCPTDWFKKERKHIFHSLWFVSKGSGQFTINGTPYKAEPGKLFFFTPGMVCEKRTDPNNPLEFYFIRFTYALAYEEKEQWHFQQAEEISFPLAGMYNIHNSPGVIYYLEQINNLWKRRGPTVAIRRKILFQELLLTIVQDFRAQKITGDTTLRIESTIEHMVNYYHDDMNVGDLAGIAGLSTSHYSRLFKKYVGYSPIDYLTHLRIDRAKEMLALSDFRVKEVSQSVGYKDELYFSRTFKKIVGLSPSQYMEKQSR